MCIRDSDNTVRQIIPYVILRRGRHYFLLRRLKKQTETRLHEKLSLGVGGHINDVYKRQGLRGIGFSEFLPPLG